MIKRLLWNDDAQAMTEYVLIISLMALLVIAALIEIIGGTVSGFYRAVIDVLST